MREQQRAGSNRQVVHQARVDAAKANWKVLSALGLLTTLVATAMVIDPLPLQVRWFLVGVVCTVFVGSIGAAIHLAAGQHHRVLGDYAERSTRAAVCGRWHRLRGWCLIEGLFFQRHGDVDHVLLGPRGVYAIETKWTSEPWKLTGSGLEGFDDRSGDPVAQARRGAEKIERMLRLGKPRLDLTVHAVLVIWGPGTPDIPGHCTTVESVTVVEGRSVRALHHRVFNLDRPPTALVAAADGRLRTLDHDQRHVI